MNLAQLFKLPVIYVCENNLYTEYTHYSECTAGDIVTRATSFGLEAATVDGQDVLSVYNTAKRLVDRARRGDGPAFLLCNTYRYHGHHVGDINREYYRSKQEEHLWKTERDPITNFGKWLIEQNFVAAAALKRVEAELEDEMKKAVEFAVAAPYPSTDEVAEDVYA
jgi:pyruvate dehydrogenase E1 component alpha subunit